ncbi:H-type small acid-soluble spore protein [Alkalibacillus aidingensis]|uniref:H-type small acid-soluble spore protein n=1 Tax=Alkalibacillus aidingensis TaxID=2747607 RepID=UPI00166032BB|nr:H-type small acid-soluble spore protein [Alkalibacillus aidingensis]
MDRIRAQEIAESPDMKNVQCHGKKVYIQHVNDGSETARVYDLNDPENEFDAQLSDLHEKI